MVHRRRRVTTTSRSPAETAAPDLVRRNFTADRPDQMWVADITYIPTQAGFLYLAAIIDVRSRRPVGWSMRDDLTTPLVTDALDMALAQRKPDHLIHHSDKGSPHTSTAFRNRCRRAGIQMSMGRRGDAYDECRRRVVLHPILETELLDRTGFADRNQARTAVFDHTSKGSTTPGGGTQPSDTTHP